jgi:hypothetical protein
MRSALEDPPGTPGLPSRVHQAREPRVRTLLSGKLVYGENMFVPYGALTLDCSVRDLSAGGAKVTIADRQPLPVDVFLIVIKHSVAHRAKVVWTAFPARGLQFLQTYAMRAPLPEHLNFLRHLWGELYVRSGGI